MLSAIKTEFLKLKRNSLIIVCLSSSFLFTLLAVLKDVAFPSGVERINQEDWLIEMLRISNFLVIFFLSSMVLGYLIHREYSDRTIKNLLVTGVPRTKIIVAKLIVWLLLHCLIYLFTFIVVYLGYRQIFDLQDLSFADISIKFLISTVTIAFVLLPLGWIGVRQRQLFYPTILVGILLAVLTVIGVSLPGSWPVIIPWSAAFSLTAIDLSGSELWIAWLSVSTTAIAGLLLTIVAFKRQEI
ncbi:ABC transporter permease [Enterococcus sp. LJL128]|uniref:ABC transporter permease n=1 Tax=Enterococcus sp. LJL51 TaxID=3416656 RepID=UPI003CEBFD57